MNYAVCLINFLCHILATQVRFSLDPLFWVMFIVLFGINYSILRWVPTQRIPLALGLLSIPSGILSWGLWLSHW